MKNLLAAGLTSIAAALFAPSALADINIGIVTSVTGPTAPLGADVKRVIDLFAEKGMTIGTEKVNLIFLDDATDPTTAVKNTRKLISENKVDALLGSNATGAAIAMAAVAAEEKVPLIVAAPVELQGDKARWVFRNSQGADLMVGRLAEHMVSAKVKTLGYIGFTDAWGDILLNEMTKNAQKGSIKIVASERFNRTDTSVTPQVLRVLAAKPDAVFIGGSGTAAALPHLALVERGFKGSIYHIHSVANKDFLRVGGKALDGALVPVGNLVVNEQLKGLYPNEAAINEFVTAYEGKYGKGSRSIFAGYAWDAIGMMKAAMVPALKTAQPGTPAFREAVRTNLEGIKNFAGASGVFNLSPTDHVGLDERSRVLVKIDNGNWVYVK
jgi:branched-chain amino acid transport system substrate-binding protein